MCTGNTVMENSKKAVTYCEAIRLAFEHLLHSDPRCFTIGQGLWSPWYVGNSMRGLVEKFGKHRVIDTPVSELATTGAAIGASLNGYNPILVHPRMDFMLLAADQIINQAAKWRHMLGGKTSPSLTIRGIINRGGEQGAQHSQALHSLFAHIPGLRVVMPAFPKDAHDLLIAAVQSPDPVLYIDDRWCYEYKEVVEPVSKVDLSLVKPIVRLRGTDITIAAAGFPVHQCLEAANIMQAHGVSCEVIDVRQISPLDTSIILESVSKTGRFLAVDGGWSSCGFAAEMLARVAEGLCPNTFLARPSRLTIPFAPAPSAGNLEKKYYLTAKSIVVRIEKLIREDRKREKID